MGDTLRKTAKLKDVAERAGLAPTTISRFLNGLIELPDATARRIIDAATALNYCANPHARSLSRGVSETIGLALPDLSNPFFGQMARALDETAQAAGRALMLSSTLSEVTAELAAIDRLERGYFATLIIATNRVDNGCLAAAVNRNADRIVVLDEDIRDARVSKVFSDNRLGGKLAGRELADAGHCELGYVAGPEGLMSTGERGQGFAEGAPGAQIRTLHCLDHLPEYGFAAVSRLLRAHPNVTGIFFGSDALLVGALGALRRLGLKVPRDLSLVTFDDVGSLALYDPAITAIRQFHDLLAGETLALLRDGLQGQRTVIRVPVELIRRESVAPPASTKRLTRRNLKIEATGSKS